MLELVAFGDPVPAFLEFALAVRCPLAGVLDLALVQRVLCLLLDPIEMLEALFDEHAKVVIGLGGLLLFRTGARECLLQLVDALATASAIESTSSRMPASSALPA